MTDTDKDRIDGLMAALDESQDKLNQLEREMEDMETELNETKAKLNKTCQVLGVVKFAVDNL